jgi:hypothetical protein
LGFGVFFLATLLLYSPIIVAHGFDQLFHHKDLPDYSWRKFKLVHSEGAMALWFHITDTGARWFSVLGLVGLVVAAYISGKYRMLAFSMLLGAVVPVLLNRYVPAPAAWMYSLFILHISMAVVLFYLLKFVQEKLWTGLGKRTRVAGTTLLLLAGTAVPAMRYLLTSDRLPRFPEAQAAAVYLYGAMEPTDRVYADVPWEDPIKFHLMEKGLDRAVMLGLPPAGGLLFVVVDPGLGQSPEEVLAMRSVAPARPIDLRVVLDQERIKIFAARMDDPAVEKIAR